MQVIIKINNEQGECLIQDTDITSYTAADALDTAKTRLLYLFDHLPDHIAFTWHSVEVIMSR